MLEEAWKTVVVLRRDDDQGIRSLHCGGKTWVFYCLPRVIDGKVQLGYIDQLRDHAFLLPDFSPNELGRMTAHAALSCRSKNHGNGKRTCFVHTKKFREGREGGSDTNQFGVRHIKLIKQVPDPELIGCLTQNFFSFPTLPKFFTVQSAIVISFRSFRSFRRRERP